MELEFKPRPRGGNGEERGHNSLTVLLFINTDSLEIPKGIRSVSRNKDMEFLQSPMSCFAVGFYFKMRLILPRDDWDEGVPFCSSHVVAEPAGWPPP